MAIEAKHIIKEFGTPPVRVLHDLSFAIEDGTFLAISGRSGSGKSTLLYIISTLDSPSQGHIMIDGKDIQAQSIPQLHAFRNHHVGFIFQFHYLLPELTALENVLLPARNLNRHQELTSRAQTLLEQFGIGNKAQSYPTQMSGGEQQRVAIARAMIMQPRYIFADEPTGNLDTNNGKIVMDALKALNREHNTTIILVTHDPSYAAMAEHEIYLVDGRIDKTSLKR